MKISCTPPGFTDGADATGGGELRRTCDRLTPVSAIPLFRLKTARMRTSAPEKRRKRREAVPSAWEERKLIPRSDGSVPRAKTNIVSAPERKLPDARATSCSDWVKPQGRKNVKAPSARGAAGC